MKWKRSRHLKNGEIILLQNEFSNIKLHHLKKKKKITRMHFSVDER